jgi:hypothetical protein
MVTVHVQLRGPDRRFRHQVIARHGIDPATCCEHRQIEPVAPIDGKFRQLTWIDVARLARTRRLHEWRVRSHGDRLLDCRWSQLKIHNGLLPNQQLHTATGHDGETLKLRGDSIGTRTEMNLEYAVVVGDSLKGVP